MKTRARLKRVIIREVVLSAKEYEFFAACEALIRKHHVLVAPCTDFETWFRGAKHENNIS